ncbi:hypothetical protein PM082_019805 [Marasmius tenuissimus]|nr:hypothetical protein PM082_019801 [Marasmius tenuissimus]KAJ8075467.1 hypothetical protein PM082_019805 [Marasmius tenuissimus]
MDNITTPEETVLIATILAQSRLSDRMGVCAVALYIYDTILNLDLELGLLWASPWTFVKAMYLLQRYLPFVDSAVVWLYLQSAHEPGPCRDLTNVYTWSGVVGIALSEGLMTLRVWAVWGRNIYVTVALGMAYVGCFTVAGFYAWKFLEGIQYSDLPLPLPNWEGCFLAGGNNLEYLIWVMVMVYDTITFIIMMIPVAKAYHGGGKAGVVKVIYQDGIKFFAVLFLCSLVNIILIATDARYTSLLTSIQRVLHPLIASRAIIHIRKQSSKQGILVASGETIRLKGFDVRTSTTNNK